MKSNSIFVMRWQNVPRERLASVSALKEDSPNTLFAALRVRRALQRSKGARETEPKVVKEEVQAIIARHQNVLSRYKIRKVSMEVVDGDEMRNLPPFMVNPHGNLYKLWQLVSSDRARTCWCCSDGPIVDVCGCRSR